MQFVRCVIVSCPDSSQLLPICCFNSLSRIFVHPPKFFFVCVSCKWYRSHFFLHFIYPCQTHFTSDIRLFHGVFEQCRNSAAHSTFTVNGLVKCERAFVCDSHEKCFHVSVCAVALKTETVSKTDSPATVLGGGPEMVTMVPSFMHSPWSLWKKIWAMVCSVVLLHAPG